MTTSELSIFQGGLITILSFMSNFVDFDVLNFIRLSCFYFRNAVLFHKIKQLSDPFE